MRAMGIAREGWPFVLPLLVLGGLVSLRFPWSGGVLLLLAAFCAFFFRDPERAVPQAPDLVVAPADGKVVQVIPAAESEGLGPGATHISIFLSIFDVHVNRAPVAGRVAAVDYNPGQFLPAFDHKASERNEQTRIRLEGDRPVVFKQIAGLIARRIVFRPKPGDRVERGERVGMIRFGSRVDVLLPAGFEVRVRVGDLVSAGASVIAEATTSQ